MSCSTFHNAPFLTYLFADWEHLKEFLERKPDRKCLDGAELQVIQVPPCKTVGISNLSNRTTKDGIKLKLEHPSCGGPGIVRDVKFKGGRNTTVVVFHKTEGKILQ